MRFSPLWNWLTISLLGLTGLVGLMGAWLFINPDSQLNPFPPSPVPPAYTAPWLSASPSSPPPASPASLYPTFPPEWTKTFTPPPTLTRTPKPTPTPTLTPTDFPTRTPTPTPLTEVRLSGIIGHKQALSLSCEARAAADWAAYFGLTIDEQEFFSRLPTSDNPETGFVGDVNGDWGHLPPDAYGVYAGPVAGLLKTYGAKAEADRGLTWDDLKKEIAEGRPVMVWVVGHLWKGEPVAYTASDGQTTTVARYEHTVLLIGYTDTRAVVVDGENTYSRPQETFLQSWSVLGNMAILWKP